MGAPFTQRAADDCFRAEAGAGFPAENPEKERTETVNVPSLQAFMEWVNEKIDNKEIEVELIQNSPNAFIGVLENVFAYLPTILLITLIILIFKMQGLRW